MTIVHFEYDCSFEWRGETDGSHDSYQEDIKRYQSRVDANPIARKVKLADLHDNLNLKRTMNPTEKDRERMLKYKKALTFFEAD
jgi:hypothetical protein